MTKLSTKVLALVAAGASALTIATQFLHEREGFSLKPYRDGKGIWTNCMGNTHGVDPNRVMTEEECAEIDARNLQDAEDIVNQMVQIPLSEPAKAAVISFCAYNIGPTKCAPSTFMRKMNVGDIKGACAEIPKWIKDGGKDCRIRSNNCFGQVDRRTMERELCEL